MRRRSRAFDFLAPNPDAEEHKVKVCIHAASGKYLNFAYNNFVEHAKLDKVKIHQHVNGFANQVANGQAKDPLLKHLAQYLTPKDFANLRLVCKP